MTRPIPSSERRGPAGCHPLTTGINARTLGPAGRSIVQEYDHHRQDQAPHVCPPRDRKPRVGEGGVKGRGELSPGVECRSPRPLSRLLKEAAVAGKRHKPWPFSLQGRVFQRPVKPKARSPKLRALEGKGLGGRPMSHVGTHDVTTLLIQWRGRRWTGDGQAPASCSRGASADRKATHGRRTSRPRAAGDSAGERGLPQAHRYPPHTVAGSRPLLRDGRPVDAPRARGLRQRFGVLYVRGEPPPPAPLEFPLFPPGDWFHAPEFPAARFEIPPDGQSVAAAVVTNNGSALWVRSIGRPPWRQLPGTEGARGLFLLPVRVQAGPPSITVVMNWPAMLRQ